MIRDLPSPRPAFEAGARYHDPAERALAPLPIEVV